MNEHCPSSQLVKTKYNTSQVMRECKLQTIHPIMHGVSTYNQKCSLKVCGSTPVWLNCPVYKRNKVEISAHMKI